MRPPNQNKQKLIECQDSSVSALFLSELFDIGAIRLWLGLLNLRMFIRVIHVMHAGFLLVVNRRLGGSAAERLHSRSLEYQQGKVHEWVK